MVDSDSTFALVSLELFELFFGLFDLVCEFGVELVQKLVLLIPEVVTVFRSKRHAFCPELDVVHDLE